MLLAHFIGVEARRAAQRLVPAERRDGLITLRFGATGAAAGQIGLRVDAGAIDPLMDDALLPVGKAVDRLPGAEVGRRIAICIAGLQGRRSEQAHDNNQ